MKERTDPQQAIDELTEEALRLAREIRAIRFSRNTEAEEAMEALIAPLRKRLEQVQLEIDAIKARAVKKVSDTEEVEPAMRSPTIRLPTVHLNGTSKAALLDGYLDAVSAVFAATEALSEAAPNARDYYPQGDDAFKQAQDEHNARMMKLNSVLFELQQLAEHVA